MAEVEHIVDWTRNRVKRSAANALALEPVVFNEANDRTLVRSRVIDEVFTGKGRNHEERQARPIAAAALRVRGADAGQCGGTAAGAAGADRRERVRGGCRLVDDGAHLVVVPAVGVVIGNNDGGALPFRRLLQEVDHVDDKGLFVRGIGVAGVAVLISWGLQETEGGEVTPLDGVKEVVNVVLVICRTAVPDLFDRSRTRMRRVSCAGVILERLVVRNVILLVDGGYRRSGTAGASRRPIRVRDGQVEASFKEAPGNSLVIQKVADALAAHAEFFASGRGANVAEWIGVAVDGVAAVTVANQ